MAHGKPFHSLNPTLNALRIANQAAEFITVSPITGVGDYSTIEDALASGATNIYVKKGTYAETADLVLSGQNLIGEDPKNTIIQLADHSIEFETHDATNAYDIQTAQVQLNNTQVLGVGGTLWDTGVNAPSGYTDPWLIIRGMAMPIESFTNDTTLDLTQQYRGDTQTGNYYIIDAKNIGSSFSGFTVEHNPTVGTVCMKVSGINVTVERNIFKCHRLNTTHVIQTGVDTNSVAIKAFIQNNEIWSGAIAIHLKNAQNCQVINNSIQSPGDHAIMTDTTDHDCWDNQIKDNSIYGPTNTAIELDSASERTLISGNRLESCRGILILADNCDYLSITNNRMDGVGTANAITLTAACSWPVIEDNFTTPHDWEMNIFEGSVCGNVVLGGNIAVTGDNNVINDNNVTEGKIVLVGNFCNVNDNNFAYGESDECILLNGEGDSAIGNIMEDAAGYGINLDGTGGHICSNNMIKSSGAAGIYVDAPNCIISGNIIDASDAEGIRTTNVADECIIKGNRIAGTTEVGIRYLGTRSMIIDNHITDVLGAYGIQLEQTGAGDGDECVIRGNTIETAPIGIYADSDNGGCKIDENLISDTTTLGIQINATGAHHWSINNNHVIDAGTIAILLDAGCRLSTISNNVIFNPGSHGIHLHTGLADLHCSIMGNTIDTAGATGILLDAEGQAAGDRNDHCIVSNNNIRGSGGRGISCNSLRSIIGGNRVDDGGDVGIYVAAGDQTIVSGNGCDNNTTNGIEIVNTADRIIITSNICLNNGANQILNNGTNTVAANNIVA